LENEIKAAGNAIKVRIEQLRLDDTNPRFSTDVDSPTQADLAVKLEMDFEAQTVAESIALNGFFTSEPLLVIVGVEPDSYIVVEGNRRLTALLGLASPTIRAQFIRPEPWDLLATQAEIKMTDQIPVVLLPNRAAATPIIGFRHITGILQWQPFAQARYIATLVDKEKKTFGEVAEMIGITKSKVGDLYRDQAILTSARGLGVDTGAMEASFSLLTVAMSNPHLRGLIGAELGSKTIPGVPPFPLAKIENVREMAGWIFGDGLHQPVIGESRDISRLGSVISNEDGLRAIRAGKTLEEAKQLVDELDFDPRDRLLKRLKAARNLLIAALEDLPENADDGAVNALIDEVVAAVSGITSVTGNA
jgi:hypothetical protein